MKSRLVAKRSAPLTSSLSNPDAKPEPSTTIQKSGTYGGPNRTTATRSSGVLLKRDMGGAPVKSAFIEPVRKVLNSSDASVDIAQPAKQQYDEAELHIAERRAAKELIPSPPRGETQASTSRHTTTDSVQHKNEAPPSLSTVTSNTIPPAPQQRLREAPDMPWPQLSAEENGLLDVCTTEPRGGEYFMHFPKTGFYACRRCKCMVARCDSKLRLQGGYAAFAKYSVGNLTLSLTLAKRDAALAVRCSKCTAFIGFIVSDVNAGSYLRANSRALWYVPTRSSTTNAAPPNSLSLEDSTFDIESSGSLVLASDDDEHTAIAFQKELDLLSMP